MQDAGGWKQLVGGAGKAQNDNDPACLAKRADLSDNKRGKTDSAKSAEESASLVDGIPNLMSAKRGPSQSGSGTVQCSAESPLSAYQEWTLMLWEGSRGLPKPGSVG